MKQIFWVCTHGKLIVNHNNREIQYTNNYIRELHYTEFIDVEPSIITSYKELIEQKIFRSYPSVKSTDKKKYGECYSSFYKNHNLWDGEIKFSDVNFVSYKIITEYQLVKNYTLQQLMDNLPAGEMIEYLKDNGLNVCPIAR